MESIKKSKESIVRIDVKEVQKGRGGKDRGDGRMEQGEIWGIWNLNIMEGERWAWDTIKWIDMIHREQHAIKRLNQRK